MLLMSPTCSAFKMQCIGYISGFIVRMLGKIIKCNICCEGCLEDGGGEESLDLFNLKQRGPLLKPSKDVIKICATTENAISLILNSTNVHDLLKDDLYKSRIIVCVVRKLSHSSLFQNLNSHQIETKSSVCLSNDHIFTLINTIINCYCKIKFFHLLRKTNDEGKSGVRQKFTHMLMFMNQ